ncbi:unnamed protein product [Mytilus edulis]|uniref:Uncharacterized protein n=1 Tax=Mytilus edulis TaxID=6550 RepID=A0A8S3QCT2_MYTED|nr:unnamed protein product [Mytilus edulis]
MSSRNEPYIQFIDLNRRKIVKQIEVHQSGGYGIAATNDSIVVGTKTEIQVLDRNGNFKRTVRLKHGQGPIGYISVGLNGNIYYSNIDEVYCITSDGYSFFSYSSPGLRGPRKIHDAKNVYISGLYSQNIHQITSTGRFVDILLEDNISEPFGLCFSKDFSTVYIANRNEKLINNRKENCSRLEEKEKNILKEIATIKQNASSRFESSKDTLLKQVSELKGKYEAGIKRQEKDLGDLVTATKSVQEELAFVRDYGSDQQAFVSIHSSKPVLDEMEYKIEQLIESFEDASLVKIYFCDEYDIYQSSIKSPYEPWDVAAIPETNMAVISGRKNPYIQFLDIERRMVTKKVKLDQTGSGGIGVTKDNIYITIKHKIQVLDLNGKLKRTISLNQEQNINWYISVCPNGNICYSNENAVHCITTDGCPMFSYASSDIRYARNTITDDVGNIYVLDYYSRNIHKISSTGTLVDKIFNDRLSGPLVFCFSKDLSKLYIANGFGTKISVFTTS